MTAVTTDGARIGVEHSDHSGCSFPFFRVTMTLSSAPKSATAGVPARPGEDAALDTAPTADATDTVSDSTTRVATE